MKPQGHHVIHVAAGSLGSVSSGAVHPGSNPGGPAIRFGLDHYRRHGVTADMGSATLRMIIRLAFARIDELEAKVADRATVTVGGAR